MPDNVVQLLSDGTYWLSGIGLLLFVCFFFGFVLPARRLRDALTNLNASLRNLKSSGEAITPEKAAPLFAARPEWPPLWSAFEKTLAPQPEGIAPAPVFTDAAVFESPLEIKFFRLLPSFLILFGVLGVFAAVLGALLDTKGELTLDKIIENTEHLLSPGVLSAIVLGFVPVFLSISANDIEKRMSASLSGQVAELAMLADLLCRPASPEALAAAAAKDEAAQREAGVIKQNLVQALEQILSTQVERQTAAIHASTAQIGGEIAKSIAAAMQQPLERMVKAAEQSNQQAEKIDRTLQTAMSSMSLELGKSVTRALEKPLEQMSQSAAQSAKQAENIQFILHNAMPDLSREIGQSITQSLEKPLGQMVGVVEKSGRQAEDVDRVLTQTMETMVQKIEASFGEQVKALNALLQENAKSLHDMRANVAQMMEDMRKNSEYVSGQTRGAIEKMDLSAQTILAAAEKFGEAGSVMNSQISHSHSLSRHMMESGMALNASAQALGGVVTDYGKARDSIGGLITSLQEIAKGIDQKVTINQSLVADMQKVADRLKEVQAQTDDYLHKVSGVLSNGFNDFGKSVHENLDKSTTTFHASMSNSVELISVQMRNLTAALQDLPDLLRKA